MNNSNIITPADLSSDPVREAHVMGALGHLMDAVCSAWPRLAPAMRAGMIVRITASNGIGLELRGGKNPNFKAPTGLIKP